MALRVFCWIIKRSKWHLLAAIESKWLEAPITLDWLFGNLRADNFKAFLISDVKVVKVLSFLQWIDTWLQRYMPGFFYSIWTENVWKIRAKMYKIALAIVLMNLKNSSVRPFVSECLWFRTVGTYQLILTNAENCLNSKEFISFICLKAFIRE